MWIRPVAVASCALLLLALVVFVPPASSAPLPWINEVVTGGGGWHPSIAIDSHDMPRVSFYCLYKLQYAEWTGTSWSVHVVDSSGGNTGRYTSLALDSSDRPRISYFDFNTNDLKYAQWNGSQWLVEVVDSLGEVGYTTLKLDSLGRPHVAYLDLANSKLKYAHWDGVAWSIEVIDPTASAEASASLALDSKDFPHISYYVRESGPTNPQVKYAHWDGAAWVNQTVDASGFMFREWSSLVLDGSDVPHIAYGYDSGYIPANRLRYAYLAGSVWVKYDVANAMVQWPSLALDSMGYPRIGFQHSYNANDVMYASWNGTAWTVQAVDTVGDDGFYGVSMVLDSRDRPHIAYYSVTDGAVRHAWIPNDAAVRISPTGPISIHEGDSRPFTANIVDDLGTNITGFVSISWSLTPGIGTITSVTGVQTTLTAGTAAAGMSGFLNASSLGRTASVAITVDHTPPATVEVSPGTAQIEEGTARSFTAVVRDAYGHDLTNSTIISWSVTGPIGFVAPSTGTTTTFVANVDAGGRVGTVVASAGGVTDSAGVTVTHAPAVQIGVSPEGPVTIDEGLSQDFTATLKDKHGHDVTSDYLISWSVSGGIGTVSPPSGAMTTFISSADAGGKSGNVTATSLSLSDQTPVIVRHSPPTRVDIDPPGPLTIEEGGSRSFVATATDSRGHDVTDDVIVSWSASPGLGSLSAATGRSTTLTIGQNVGDSSGTIVATAGFRTAIVPIQTTHAQSTSLVLSPEEVTLYVGESVTFSYALYDLFGHDLTGIRQAAWGLTGNIGMLSQNGNLAVLLATSGGTAEVTVTSGSLTARSTVIVRELEVAIENPSNASTVSGTIVVTGRSGNATAVEVRIDGGVWSHATGLDIWQFEIQTRALADGAHQVEARAVRGNSSVSAVISIVVLNAPTSGPSDLGVGLFGIPLVILVLAVITILVAIVLAIWLWRRRKS